MKIQFTVMLNWMSDPIQFHHYLFWTTFTLSICRVSGGFRTIRKLLLSLGWLEVYSLIIPFKIILF